MSRAIGLFHQTTWRHPKSVPYQYQGWTQPFLVISPCLRRRLPGKSHWLCRLRRLYGLLLALGLPASQLTKQSWIGRPDGWAVLASCISALRVKKSTDNICNIYWNICIVTDSSLRKAPLIGTCLKAETSVGGRSCVASLGKQRLYERERRSGGWGWRQVKKNNLFHFRTLSWVNSAWKSSNKHWWHTRPEHAAFRAAQREGLLTDDWWMTNTYI